MIPCKQLLHELSNFLDGEIDATLRQELEEHMGNCPDCRVILDTTRKTVQIFRGCEPYPLPQSLHDRLQDAVRKHCEKTFGKTS